MKQQDINALDSIIAKYRTILAELHDVRKDVFLLPDTLDAPGQHAQRDNDDLENDIGDVLVEVTGAIERAQMYRRFWVGRLTDAAA